MAGFETCANETITDLRFGVADLYEQCRFERIDFAGQRLSQVNFVECSFVGCSFAGVQVGNAGFNDCRFESCKLVGINFGDLAQETLAVSFENCRLDSCIFDTVTMKKTHFGRSDLFRCEFSRADLSGSNFSGCDCRESRFLNCNLEKVDLREVQSLDLDLRINRVAGAKLSIDAAVDLLSYFGIELS